MKLILSGDEWEQFTALLLHFGCSAERTTVHLSSEKELEMLLLLSSMIHNLKCREEEKERASTARFSKSRVRMLLLSFASPTGSFVSCVCEGFTTIAHQFEFF